MQKNSEDQNLFENFFQEAEDKVSSLNEVTTNRFFQAGSLDLKVSIARRKD